MKIAYDGQIFLNQRFGGISRYFTQLSEEMAARQQDAKFFAPLHQNTYLKELPKKMSFGVGIKRMSPRFARFAGNGIFFAADVGMKLWNPDVVHRTYYGRSMQTIRSAPIILTVYDMIHEIFNSEFSPQDRTAELKKAAINGADHIICISYNTKYDLMNLLKIPESKISVTHLGVQEVSKPIGVENYVDVDQTPYILYVGARSGYKNFSRLLQSMAASKKLHNKIKLVAFGGGPFSTSEKCEIEALKFDRGTIVQVTGDDWALSRYYKDACALVYPSLYEGFGLPPLEAMINGCPVISSNTSSMPEVIGDAAEYFEPSDLENMAHAVETVLYSEERRSDLIQKGLIRAKRFSWANCADKTLSVYQAVR